MLPPRPPGEPAGPGPGPGWGHRRPAGPPRRLPIPGRFVGGFVNNLCNTISSCIYFFCCCWLLRDCFGASIGPLAGPPPPPQVGSYGPLSGPPGPPEDFGDPRPSHNGFYGPQSGPPSPPRVFGGSLDPPGMFGAPSPIGPGAPPGPPGPPSELEGLLPF